MCVGDEGVRSRIRSRSTTSYHPPPPPRPSLFPCYSTEFLFGRENENSWCKARSSERAAGVRVGSSEAQQIGAPPPRCTRVLRFRGTSSLRHSGRGPHAMLICGNTSGLGIACRLVLRPIWRSMPNIAHRPQTCPSSRDLRHVSYQGSRLASQRVGRLYQDYKEAKVGKTSVPLNWFLDMKCEKATRWTHSGGSRCR